MARFGSSGIIRISITLLAALIAIYAQWGGTPTSSLFADEWLRDQFLRVQVSNAPDSRVLVVDIDEASLSAIGPWPWPHERLADLAEILITDYEARGVALDILLTEVSGSEGERRLSAMATHGTLVLAQAFDFQAGRPVPLRVGVLAGAVGVSGNGIVASGYIANHAGLAAARHVGNIGYIPDEDGVLRRVPLLANYDGRDYPALALALIQCCDGGDPALPITGPLMRVPYVRDWNAYTVVSAIDILESRIDHASINNRLVLVGSSSLGLGDRVATPLASNRPGLSVQATILSALLDLKAGASPAPWPGQLIGCLFAAVSALAAHIALPRLSALASVMLLAASSLVWLTFVWFAAAHDPGLSTTGPLAANLFLLASAVPFQWQLAQRRTRHLLDTLRQYVAPAVVTELLRSDVKDPLKPRQLEVTTLIADMEGYTTQVESLPVEEAATLTRDFLDCLTGPVIARQGTLDKYTGDGLVAFWGAPLPIAHHADQALDAALDIVRQVAQLSARRVLSGKPPLRVRIGIESGDAMAGDFGTSFRSIYTAVGDSVNTAARLEQAARDFPYDVIVGTGTVARATSHRFMLLGERRLRGKENPTTLYTFDTRTQDALGLQASHIDTLPAKAPT